MASLGNIVILTAVEREYEKIRERLSNFIEESIHGGNRYEKFHESINSFNVDIIIGMTGQGPNEAATRTSHALLTYNPILIIFVGTCGFIKDVQIKDIVVATRVYDFLRGRDEDETFRSKPVSKEINATIRSYCESLAQKINRGELLKEIFRDDNCSVILGPVACSQIIVSGNLARAKQLILKNYADVIAVETEGYGFHTAVHENGFHNAVVIRGASDDSSHKENSTDEVLQPKVMKRASAFVFEFIRFFLEQKFPIKPSKPKSLTNTPNILTDFFSKEHNKDRDKLLKSKNNIFCGFFSFEVDFQKQKIEEKMHLGHCYFIKLIDELLANDKKSILFVCTTSQLIKDMDKEKYDNYLNILKDMKERWNNCFNEKIQIIDMREYLQAHSIQDDKFLQDFNKYYNEIHSNLQKLGDDYIFGEISTPLENWRETRNLADNYYKKIEEYLNVNPKDMKIINKEEVISMMYLLVRRPDWFEPKWFAEILQFLKYSIQNIVANYGINNIVLIESMRNSYVWEAASFCLKKIQSVPIINRLYFKTVPNISLDGFMKTSGKESTIFIRDFDNRIEDVSPEFLNKVLDLFKQKSIEDLKKLINTYKKRLNIT